MGFHFTRRYGIFMALIVGIIFVAIGMERFQVSARFGYLLFILVGIFLLYLGLRDDKGKKKK